MPWVVQMLELDPDAPPIVEEECVWRISAKDHCIRVHCEPDNEIVDADRRKELADQLSIFPDERVSEKSMIPEEDQWIATEDGVDLLVGQLEEATLIESFEEARHRQVGAVSARRVVDGQSTQLGQPRPHEQLQLPPCRYPNTVAVRVEWLPTGGPSHELGITSGKRKKLDLSVSLDQFLDMAVDLLPNTLVARIVKAIFVLPKPKEPIVERCLE